MATSDVSQTFRRQYSDTGKDICTLCCEEAGAWAVGPCDHFVCLTCSVRLRVLCGKKECPVCREVNDKVVVFQKPQSFQVPKQPLKDRKHGLIFSRSSLMNYYDSIKAYRCSVCYNGGFANMRQLFDHTRREHGLVFCEICLDNLKLFPSEHKLYTRQDLIRHRREGDPDDKSHKGHPQCEFCDERYFDKDELFFHLKKNHFWCHFCEPTGIQQYYPDYGSLRVHFRSEHYLCEEGPCRYEKFTNVFLSKLDFQAHKAKAHVKGLSKTEAKQLRQIDVGFTYRKERGDGAHQRGVGSGRSTNRLEEVSINELRTSDTHPSIQGATCTSKENEQRVKNSQSTVQQGVMNLTGGGGVEKVTILKEQPKEKQIKIEIKPDFKEPPIRKKPPGLEHVIPLTVGMDVRKKVDEDNDEHTTDEWPSLGIASLRTPPPTNSGQFSLTVVTGGNEPAEVPVLPPPGFSVDHVVMSTKSFTEYQILEDAMKFLKNDPEKINYFKVLSGQFQKEQITVTEYDGKCSKLFGQNWKEFGARLASTLPTLAKRQELLSVLCNNVYEQSVTQTKPPPGFTVANDDISSVSASSASSSTSVNNTNGEFKGNKKSKKKRNRNGGNTSVSTGTGTVVSSNSVWNPPATAKCSGGKTQFKDSEFPSLGASRHMSEPCVPVPVPAWSMKVAVK